MELSMFCRSATSTSRLLTTLVLLAGLAACGGGDSSTSDAPPTAEMPPVVLPTGNPTAAFAALSAATAQTPIAFDASSSTSADGSALQYVWDFGDGVRGGGVKIAHAFAAAGSRSVTLTVIDAGGRQGQSTRGVEVGAGAAAVGTVVVHAAVVDADGAALPGVVIGKPGSATPSGTTDAAGLADVTLDKGPLLVLRLTKTGYADQTGVVHLPANAGTDTRIDAVLRPRDAAQTLADAHLGGSLTGRAGATITLPSDALVTAGGALATGAVSIAMTTVDPTLAGGGGFPGRFDGVTPDGATTPIVSFGTVEFVLGDPANRLQLAPGKTATIELPVMANRKLDGSAVTVGDTIPLWSLDETTGVWIQEGTGTIVANAGAASGLAMRAVVSHFSWWNTDLRFDPYGPEPDCQYDTDIGIPEARDTFNTATVCNMLAEIDRTLSTGVPTAARARTLAATPTNPAIAGFARRTTVAIGGGESIVVPANTDIVLSATALNGTWAGRVVVNGPVLKQEPVVIKMRPLQAIGQTAEPLTLPVTNLVRATVLGQSGRFSFTAGELQTAKFQIYPITGSLVSGTARLLQGTTVLASAPFSNLGGSTTVANLLIGLPAAGSYILEVLTDQSGAVSINGALLGGVTSETLGVPADVTRIVPTYGAYRATFDLAAAATVHFAAKSNVFEAKGEIRLTGPAGNVLWSRSNVGNINAETVELALPAGRYVFTYSRTDVNVTSLRFTSEVTDWLPVADGLVVDDIFSVLDMVADRNGKPIVGVLRHPVVNHTTTSTMQLKRFTGTVWEDVGSTISIPIACDQHTTSFAFDSSNTPTIVYMTRTASGDASFTTARRLVAGVWQAIGPNDGLLPQSPGTSGLCSDSFAPRLAIDAADRPIVAYRNSDTLWVQRFDGTAWNKIAPTAAESFPVSYGSFDLRLDPAGAPWLVMTQNGATANPPTVVRRLDATSGTWVTVGPNGGVLPETNTSGFDIMRLQFDAGGRPVVAGTIAVGLDTFSRGTAVYRFDGSTWSTTGGYQLANSYVNYPIPGFAMLGNDALLSWYNQYPQSNAAGVVQRNTPTGWSAFGLGVDGALAAYTAKAATTGRLLSDSRLLVVGRDVYMVGIAPVLSSSVIAAPLNIVLLKKTP